MEAPGGPRSTFLSAAYTRACRNPGHIILPEGDDSRVQAAAVKASSLGIANVSLLGNKDRILQRLSDLDADNAGIIVIDPASDNRLEEYTLYYQQLRNHRSPGKDEAIRIVSSPLGYAAMAVRAGHADGTLGGAVATTADTIRTALQIIGRAPGVNIVSSFFLMIADKECHPCKGEFLFADCALIVEPDSDELATIGISTSRSAQYILNEEPRVAFLSFSTAGSGKHKRVDTVKHAVEIMRHTCPDIMVEGEIQVDAAVDAITRERKIDQSQLTKTPNVFVFPNLDAGNIGYKIAERFGGLTAIGPILQGLSRPANDLSRGCSAADILDMIAITSLQARLAENQQSNS